MLENVILIRNIFYRCFAIGVLFLIVTYILYFAHKDWTINETSTFLSISKHEANFYIVYFIGLMRIFLLFLFLIPALALQWSGYSLKKQIKNT